MKLNGDMSLLKSSRILSGKARRAINCIDPVALILTQLAGVTAGLGIKCTVPSVTCVWPSRVLKISRVPISLQTGAAAVDEVVGGGTGGIVMVARISLRAF